jgi:hypothetical protein
MEINWKKVKPKRGSHWLGTEKRDENCFRIAKGLELSVRRSGELLPRRLWVI